MPKVVYKGFEITTYLDRPNCSVIINSMSQHYNSLQAAKVGITAHIKRRKQHIQRSNVATRNASTTYHLLTAKSNNSLS